MDSDTPIVTEPEFLKRITVRTDVFGGKPDLIIPDMRTAVEHVLGMLAAGETEQTILLLDVCAPAP